MRNSFAKRVIIGHISDPIIVLIGVNELALLKYRASAASCQAEVLQHTLTAVIST